jgi:hypothetical protein
LVCPRKRSSFCKSRGRGISLSAPYRLLQTNPSAKAKVLQIHLSALAVLANVRSIPRLSAHLPLAFIVRATQKTFRVSA